MISRFSRRSGFRPGTIYNLQVEGKDCQQYSEKRGTTSSIHSLIYLLFRPGSSPHRRACSVNYYKWPASSKIPLRRNITSVQCNGCKNWCQMGRCTQLQSRSTREWTTDYIAACCTQAPPPPVNTNPMPTAPRTSPPTPNPPPSTYRNSDTTSISRHLRNRRNIRSANSLTPAPTRILQFNCNGLSKNIDEILDYVERSDIVIAFHPGDQTFFQINPFTAWQLHCHPQRSSTWEKEAAWPS